MSGPYDPNLIYQSHVGLRELLLAAVITQRVRDSLLGSAIKFLDVCSVGQSRVLSNRRSLWIGANLLGLITTSWLLI
ncbi:hypothetical protein LR1_13820 [Lacticaseibacillus rhamnosus DSM 20021 = JCM 1136 = NBRC 3425]|nr:hypothetical protein LR1_13820 [Lacticaseibacillus rhamnosus DSM 20021 = JCM 1136 = NBRC 3425]